MPGGTASLWAPFSFKATFGIARVPEGSPGIPAVASTPQTRDGTNIGAHPTSARAPTDQPIRSKGARGGHPLAPSPMTGREAWVTDPRVHQSDPRQSRPGVGARVAG